MRSSIGLGKGRFVRQGWAVGGEVASGLGSGRGGHGQGWPGKKKNRGERRRAGGCALVVALAARPLGKRVGHTETRVRLA